MNPYGFFSFLLLGRVKIETELIVSDNRGGGRRRESEAWIT